MVRKRDRRRQSYILARLHKYICTYINKFCTKSYILLCFFISHFCSRPAVPIIICIVPCTSLQPNPHRNPPPPNPMLSTMPPLLRPLAYPPVPLRSLSIRQHINLYYSFLLRMRKKQKQKRYKKYNNSNKNNNNKKPTSTQQQQQQRRRRRRRR